jgi:hypothetical protein
VAFSVKAALWPLIATMALSLARGASLTGETSIVISAALEVSKSSATVKLKRSVPLRSAFGV